MCLACFAGRYRGSCFSWSKPLIAWNSGILEPDFDHDFSPGILQPCHGADLHSLLCTLMQSPYPIIIMLHCLFGNTFCIWHSVRGQSDLIGHRYAFPQTAYCWVLSILEKESWPQLTGRTPELCGRALWPGLVLLLSLLSCCPPLVLLFSCFLL